MKNAIIFHGTQGDSNDNWIPWLKKELEKRGWQVWAPDLPGADYPNTKRYNEFLLKNAPAINEETIMIGHSSGCLAILGFLQALPEKTKIKAAYLIGAFKDDLNWKDESGRLYVGGLFEEPYDFPKLRQRAQKYIIIHSDNDPFCPMPHAAYLAVQLGGELLIQPGQQHFSTSTMGDKYKEFPFLLEIIEKNEYDHLRLRRRNVCLAAER